MSHNEQNLFTHLGSPAVTGELATSRAMDASKSDRPPFISNYTVPSHTWRRTLPSNKLPPSLPSESAIRRHAFRQINQLGKPQHSVVAIDRGQLTRCPELDEVSHLIL